MSEVKLNLIDSQQVLHGTIHGSVADACVAALSAEPETIGELASALARYDKRLDDHGPFVTFQSSQLSDSYANPPLDAEPWDAGIVAIDLAARIVACESTYSAPGPSGEVHYHDGTKATDIPVLYRLPDDWLFVSSVEAYQWSRERRARVRLAKPPLDAREVLYGRPLLEFIVDECAKSEALKPVTDDSPRDPNSVEAEVAQELSAIHARWLMTPRDDLGGASPRDVMLAKQDFIDFDLHTRSLQWSFQNEGPPCLATDSFAYRYAGFGTHEWVIYYDLVRYLLCNWPGGLSPDPTRETMLAGLKELKTAWLEQPQEDLNGRIPAILIENERKRLPIALRPRDMIVDEDCPVCQAFGDETTTLGMGVGFWHLDGCNMDEEFAFSSYKTREEWEAENLRLEEFNREFNRRWKERQQRIARGEPLEHDPFFDPNPFPEREFDEASLVSSESRDDEELPQ